MAKINHGISIDIEDQVKLNNTKEDEEKNKIINEKYTEDNLFYKKSSKKNILYRLLNRFKNLIYQLKFFLLIIIYSIIGALLFIYIEKDYDLASKQESYNYHLVARDMLFHNLKQIHIENKNDRENRWKEAILEFETNINASPPSLETSWTFSMAIFYAGTIYTTIGYGNIACATTIGRIVSIIYAFVGIPIFLIILNNLNEFLLKKIKTISIIFEDIAFYYSIRFGLLKLEGEKRVQHYKKLKKKNNLENLIENELTEFPKIPENNDKYIKIEVEEEEKKIIHDPPILTGVFVTLIWIFLSAGLFCLWEDWTYGSSTYFIFISLLTIGFGDIYPVNKPELFCWAFGAVIIGLSLVTVCISLCQEKIELLYKAILDKLLEDYIKALESGDPNAVKDAMSNFGGKAKFIMPLISKSKGLKMMEQLKSDAKEKGIDLPPSISSVNPETGRPTFCDTNKDKLDNLIKNEKLNNEKRPLIPKNQLDKEKTMTSIKNSEIQTDESLLDDYIKNNRRDNNYNSANQIRSIINDNIVQTENKRIINSDVVSNVKVLTTSRSAQTNGVLLQDCGIQPDVSYIVKHLNIKNNELKIIKNNEELKCKNINSYDENIYVNFMKDTASDPIDVLTYKNITAQTQDITLKSKRSQTRFTGIVKSRRNIKDHHNLNEYELQKNKNERERISNDGITKKEKRHLKNFLLKIRKDNDNKLKVIDNINGNVDNANKLTNQSEIILLMKELNSYRLINNIHTCDNNVEDVYDYELKSEAQQIEILKNVSLDFKNYSNKDKDFCDELNLGIRSRNLKNSDLTNDSKNNDVQTFSNAPTPTIQEENSSILLDNQDESYQFCNKYPSQLENIIFPNHLNNDNLKIKVGESTDGQNDDNNTNIKLVGDVLYKNPNNETNETSSNGEKYEEVTINIELTKKLKHEGYKLITNKEKDYIIELTRATDFLYDDSNDSDEFIDNTKMDQLRKLHDKFSSEEDNLSIEELFTDKWSQTINEFELKKPKIVLEDKICQFDKTIELSNLIGKICQTDSKNVKNNDTQTLIHKNNSIQCQTITNDLHNVECQTKLEMTDVFTQEPYRDSQISDGIYIRDIGIQASCTYGNFTCQYNYEATKIDSQTQYISSTSDFGSQYIYKPNTTSIESQIKVDCLDFNSQYTFKPFKTDSEVQVSCRKKENNTQTEVKFYEDQAVQFTLEQVNEETQVGFDDGIISRNTSLKSLTTREIECIIEGAEDYSKLSLKNNSKEDIPSFLKFTLFNDNLTTPIKSKKHENDFITAEEENNTFSSCSSHLNDIIDRDLETQHFQSEIKVQHFNKKLEFTNFGEDVVNNSFKDELCTDERNFSSIISNIKTENKNAKNAENVVDVGIQTGVLARVQHIYGDGQKMIGTSETVNTPPPEFQKVNLKKLHAIDDKGVYRSVDVTPPTSPSSYSIKKKLSLKRDRSSKTSSDSLRSLTKEGTVPDLIRSFSTYEEHEDLQLSTKSDPSKKNK
uniref:Potassium channel subfamily K member 18 (inferred by orthology to a human protein) n=1 Tax=Strongyloides venezuelensis TaxID=75913 RepID=A0A0K0FKH1_STRVS